MSKPIRLLIADDHAIVREGQRALIETESGMTLVGEAVDGVEVVDMARTLEPDVILIDLLMPRKGGAEAIQEIKIHNPGARILVLTSFAEDEQVYAAIKAGASGYLIKECAFDELVKAVWTVSADRTFFSPSITDTLIEDYISKLQKGDTVDSSILTPREREVLQLLAEGKNAREIASILNISMKTVDTHRRKIMDDLNIRTIAGITKYAIREGLSSLET